MQGSPTSARQSGQASSVGGSMHRSQPLSTHHSGNPQPLQTTSSSASVPTRQPSPSHVAGSLSSRHPFQPHTGQILHSITPPLSGQLPAATPQSHYQPSRTSPRAPRQVSPCRTMTPQPHGLSPCQPRCCPPHIATSSSAVGIRLPSGLSAQQVRHTPPGNTASLSVGAAHLVQSIMSCPSHLI